MDIQQRDVRERPEAIVATYNKGHFHKLTSQKHKDKLFPKERLKKVSNQMKNETQCQKCESRKGLS